MLDTADLLQPIEGGSQADVLDVLRPLIDATIRRLNSKQFLPDPIAGPHFSRIVSVMSSAYKRHGHIIERAILEQLQRHPQFEVWTDALFQVPENAIDCKRRFEEPAVHHRKRGEVRAGETHPSGRCAGVRPKQAHSSGV
jgi:hypothetical protein